MAGGGLCDILRTAIRFRTCSAVPRFSSRTCCAPGSRCRMAQHPAMLYYLDNWRSAAPDSTAHHGVAEGELPATLPQELSGRRMPFRGEAQRKLRPRADGHQLRHTLGVNGARSAPPDTQQDVVAVARASASPPGAFTGDQVDDPRGTRGRGRVARAWDMAGGHEYASVGPRRPPQHIDDHQSIRLCSLPRASAMHDRGLCQDRSGASQHPAMLYYLAGRGKQDGDENYVLALLARHPATARPVATQLVRRVVADPPPPALEDHEAGVFLRTGGDLREVTRALFTAEEFYAARHREAKVKTPFELVVSALRVTDATVANPRGVMQTLRTFGHLPYYQTAPTGYPTMSEDWTNSGAMLNRMNFGLALASGRVPGVRAEMAPVPLDALIARVFAGAPRPRLAQVIQQELAGQGGAPRALGLVLGSPDFQRR